METQNFSVSMSVYKKDDPVFFKEAVQSIYTRQTVKPSEIILVVDGPVPETINDTINGLQKEIPVLKVVWLKENVGHAKSRQTGLNDVTNDYCALMDSDDISVPDRFEKQIMFLKQHPEVDILGGQIDEFIGTVDSIVARRSVSLSNSEIFADLKKRCPMNQMTCMFKKSSVMKAGGYLDWFCNEDYYLWNRMYLQDMVFANLTDCLVKVRVGSDMYARRGGWKYFCSEAKLQHYMLKNGIISLSRFIYNVLIRLIVQVLMPNWLRGWVFRTFARK